MKSFENFTLKKGEMNVIKGGKTVIRCYSTTGLLLYDIDAQMYYDVLGNVVTTTEAVA
jgi:hypothetical protein